MLARRAGNAATLAGFYWLAGPQRRAQVVEIAAPIAASDNPRVGKKLADLAGNVEPELAVTLVPRLVMAT